MIFFADVPTTLVVLPEEGREERKTDACSCLSYNTVSLVSDTYQSFIIITYLFVLYALG